MEILASIEWFISRKENTRLTSIESQPKKVVVVGGVLVFVLIIVGHKNLTLKFGKNWVNLFSIRYAHFDI